MQLFTAPFATRTQAIRYQKEIKMLMELLIDKEAAIVTDESRIEDFLSFCNGKDELFTEAELPLISAVLNFEVRKQDTIVSIAKKIHNRFCE